MITEKDLSKYFGDDTSSGKTCDCYDCIMKDKILQLIRLEEYLIRDAKELGRHNVIGNYISEVLEESK